MKKVPARVRKIENEKLYRIKWIRMRKIPARV